MSRRSVAVIGSLAYDWIFDYRRRFRDDILPEKVHALSVSFTVQNVRQSYGGTAGNIAYTLALLGVRPHLFSSVGNDFGPYRRWLTGHGADVHGVSVVRSQRTAAAYIITDREDNQITACHPGALAAGIRESLVELGRRAPGFEYAIIAPGDARLMSGSAVILRRLGVPYLFDPGQMLPVLSPSSLRRMLQGAAGFISNDYELALLLRRARMSRSALARQVPFAVTTLGEKGAMLLTGQRTVRVAAARPARVEDPTGAGDAFRAGLLAALVGRVPLPDAVRAGAVASVYTVERNGTQTHRFSHAGFLRRFRQNFHQPIRLFRG